MKKRKLARALGITKPGTYVVRGLSDGEPYPIGQKPVKILRFKPKHFRVKDDKKAQA